MKSAIALLLILLVAALHAADVEYFDEGPQAGKGYPFSESVRVGDILFLSGTLGVGANDELPEGGIVPESAQLMKNIRAALERRGLGMSNVVKCTVFLADMSEWSAMNEVYRTFFENPPARSALGASGLALDARVEIECIAVTGDAEKA